MNRLEIIFDKTFPMETRLPKEKFHGRGAIQEEALLDCINENKDIDRDRMFD